jgi:ankyrin repeat protein
MSLFDAVAAGDLERVKAALAQSGDANPFDAEGRTPLMLAAERGDTAILQALIAGGADPDLTDRIGESALAKAAANGHRRIVSLLMPLASADEQAMAQTLLRVSANPSEPARPPAEPTDDSLRRKLASASAYVADKLGHSAPAERLERLRRAEKNSKKS